MSADVMRRKALVERAIEIVGGGVASRLAEALDVDRATLSRARSSGVVSAGMAWRIEQLTGGSISAAELCPELVPAAWTRAGVEIRPALKVAI